MNGTKHSITRPRSIDNFTLSCCAVGEPQAAHGASTLRMPPHLQRIKPCQRLDQPCPSGILSHHISGFYSYTRPSIRPRKKISLYHSCRPARKCRGVKLSLCALCGYPSRTRRAAYLPTAGGLERGIAASLAGGDPLWRRCMIRALSDQFFEQFPPKAHYWSNCCFRARFGCHCRGSA